MLLMRRVSSLLLAVWFAVAMLLAPALHAHGISADCQGSCGSHGHIPAPVPADGPSHDDCPACQFAATAAIAAAGTFDTAPTMLEAEPALRILWSPSAPPCLRLPPSCGPPRA